MNCPDCHNRLQQWLDARIPEAEGGPPALCAACAEWAAAARRLDRGLRLTAAPVPPPHLAGRIVSDVRARRRSRRFRNRFVAGLVAAAVVALVAWRGFQTDAPPPRPPAARAPLAAAPDHTAPVATAPTLRDSMAEASSAVAALTTHAAGATVENTKGLLPALPDSSLGRLDLETSLDPAARSLRETGQGVSAGLEPVADSARRAVGLFLRELPVDAAPKAGL